MSSTYVESVIMDKIESKEKYMTTDEVAAQLVKLYGEYRATYGCHDDKYAEAVGVAIRMLTD